ncbi:TerD family protein [Nocardioides sp. P5_E3]
MTARGDEVPLGDRAPTGLVAEVTFTSGPIAVDLYAFVCDDSGSAISPQYFIYHGNPVTPERSVFLLEDRAAGVSRGGQLMVDVTTLPEEATALEIALVATQLGQTLEPVSDINCQVWSAVDGLVLATYEFGRPSMPCDAVIIAGMRRRDGQWLFRSKGEHYEKDHASLVRDFGVPVS